MYLWLMFSETCNQAHIQNIGLTTSRDVSVLRITLTAMFRLCWPFCYGQEHTNQNIFNCIFVHLQNGTQAIRQRGVEGTERRKLMKMG